MSSVPLIALPLFPLGTVLFPGGLLPLRVFELRYLEMVRRVHREGTLFGVVCLTQGREVRAAGAQAEQFESIGTLARVDLLQTPQAGLLQVECIGTRRFRIERSERAKNGLWSADVQLLDDDVAMGLPADLQHTATALRRLVDTLEQRRQQQGDDGPELPLRAPYRFDDCGWVANRWCELLPLPAHLKQGLMTLQSPLMRLELVSDLLERSGITG